MIEIIIIAIGLSFDTFAVSISAGIIRNSIKFWQGVRIAFIMAFFQALLPFIGWLGGTQIHKYIVEFDHWVAFLLLSMLGIKMIFESFKSNEKKSFNPLLLSVVVLMALATSIDALVVGISLAFMKINIYKGIVIIGLITFLVSMLGMLLGKNADIKLGKKIEILG